MPHCINSDSFSVLRSVTILPATSRPGATVVPVLAGCDFESRNLCGYKQDRHDNFDWTRKAGPTRSSNTGPSTDHTMRTNTGRTEIRPLTTYTRRSTIPCIVQELCESRGGRPELSVLTSLLASVDVKIY